VNPGPAKAGAPSLGEIDAELDAADLGRLEAALRQRGASPGLSRSSPDDQATRLRSLMADTPAAAVAPAVAPIPRWPAPADAPAARVAPVITIASGKGGVGKTNVAVNLCIALARRGARVTLLDADLGTANADLLCGLRPSARLHHALGAGGLSVQDAGRRSLRDLAVEAPGGFRLVPGSTGVARMADLTLAERRALLDGLAELEKDADVVVIDAAAGVGRDVTAFMLASDLSLVVTTPEPTALADAYALIKCVSQAEHGAGLLSDQRLGVVINQAADPLEGYAVHARLTRVCRRFLGADAPLSGIIAHDVRVAQAVRAQTPLLVGWPESDAALNISTLGAGVADLLGVRLTSTASEQRRRGLSALVRRLLGV
jgi:flagellar biosynthesis protein FlhG